MWRCLCLRSQPPQSSALVSAVANAPLATLPWLRRGQPPNKRFSGRRFFLFFFFFKLRLLLAEWGEPAQGSSPPVSPSLAVVALMGAERDRSPLRCEGRSCPFPRVPCCEMGAVQRLGYNEKPTRACNWGRGSPSLLPRLRGSAPPVPGAAAVTEPAVARPCPSWAALPQLGSRATAAFFAFSRPLARAVTSGPGRWGGSPAGCAAAVPPRPGERGGSERPSGRRGPPLSSAWPPAAAA